MSSTLSSDSFNPSGVLVRLLYYHISAHLDSSVHDNMAKYTKSQFRLAFDHAINCIRDRTSLNQIADDKLWLVSESCEINPDFYREIKNRIEVHHAAEFDNRIFVQRFAEEIMHWVVTKPAEARRLGIVHSRHQGRRCVSLVRKPRIETTVALMGFA